MKRKSRLRGFLTNIGLLVFSSLAALVIFELLLRLFLNPVNYLKPDVVTCDTLGVKILPHSSGHDAWGFRNETVPATADIVTIGDSQTYGYAAPANSSWPAQLQKLTHQSVYNLSLGFYGPVQYACLLEHKALQLRPKTIIVGLYYGNDLINAYDMVYGNEIWAGLRSPDFKPVEMEAPIVEGRGNSIFRRLAGWLDRRSFLYRFASYTLGERYRQFRIKHLAQNDGDIIILEDPQARFSTGLTPSKRLEVLDLDKPETVEGLRLTLGLLEKMADLCKQENVDFVVLLIPTKESVYAPWIDQCAATRASPVLQNLLTNEERVHLQVTDSLKIHKIPFVEVLRPLQEAAAVRQIYPGSDDGHPNANGYEIIARTVQQFLETAPHEKTEMARQ